MVKNILLTGISRGLGLVITELLLRNDYCVFGISRKESAEIKELKRKFRDNLNVLFYDLHDIENIKLKIFQQFISPNTPIHGFVNNAAVAYDDLITNNNLENLDRMFRINVFAPIHIVKYFIRNTLFHKSGGVIVHISSISVHTGYKGLAMYAASKGAIEAFSKNTSREWGKKDIRSNCIIAGFMETEMNSELSADQKERIYRRTSLGSATSMQSVAEMVLFLLSEKSASITGQNIFVDSGTI